MSRKLMFGGGILAGLGLMSLLDRDYGKRRRAILRDKLARGWNEFGDGAGTTWRDLRNRARGLVAEMRSIADDKPVPDAVLVERVRAALGRVVSHPGAIEVQAQNGRVTLSGPVFADEADELVSCVSKVRGVTAVEDRLQRHKEADGVPGLQGGRRPIEPRFEYMQRNWSPSARLIAGTAGAGLFAYGIRRRGPLGWLAALFGGGLAARSVTNLELERLLGMGRSRRGIDLRNAIEVAAPADEVFRFWSHFENFPRFLLYVREVRDNGQGRTHWKVAGPGGAEISWDAVITEYIPNQLIAWKSVPAAAIRQAGIVRFDPTEENGTRIEIRMTYKPPAGAIGHAVAGLLGSDPIRMMDEYLMRFKSLIEAGKTTSHDQTVRKEGLAPSRVGPPPAASRSEGAEPKRPERRRRPRTPPRGPEPTA